MFLTKLIKMKISLIFILILFFTEAKAPVRNFKFESFLNKKSLKFYKKTEYDRFKRDLRFQESGNNWKCINSIGALGYYQFMPNTLKSLGYELDVNLFKKDPYVFPPSLQEILIDNLIEKNIKSLKYYINNYHNKHIRGVFITKSGLIAAAHLSGCNGVKRWINTGYNARDCNNTYLTNYLIKFSGYNF